MAAADHHLLFGLLALQNGIINQGQLLAAFQAWTLDKARGLADHLVVRGDLTSARRAVLDALAAVHLETHGGNLEQSLAAVASSRSTRASVAGLGEPEIEATIARVTRGKKGDATEPDVGDSEGTVTCSVGTATSDGQRFRILRPHARGGLGAVFIALDSELHREVALKQILEKHADDPVSRERFVAEAEITGGLEHPGVVPVYGLGNDAEGHPYYAMRFIKGDSLKAAIEAFHERTNTKLPSPLVGGGRGGDAEALPGSRDLELRKLLRRFTDVCNAIDYAHSRGVIHRDLKPANIIVGKHGETLVVDWGLAKAVGRADPSAGEQTLVPSSGGSSETLPGSALGTPAYMSPEQARGEIDQIGPRSDVYSLGATLYCLLTGKPPFEGDDVGEILRAVQNGKFSRPCQLDPAVDRALEAVCLKAMAARPADRYPTPRALTDDLERWMADEPVTAWREPFSRRARRWARRNRTAVTAAAAAVLVALAGTAAVLAVQTRANANLHAANVELAASNQRERARFELAQEAIRMFHTGVSEDLLLKQKEFGTLRTKLLRGAQDFYRKLEELLNGQKDRDSRLSLGRAYSEVGELSRQLDSIDDAQKINLRAVALFEAISREDPANPGPQHDLARSLESLAIILTGVGRSAEAMEVSRRSLALYRKLAEADPGDRLRQGEWARGEMMYAASLHSNHHQSEAIDSIERARAIIEKPVEAGGRPEDVEPLLADVYGVMAQILNSSGRGDEALAAYRRARDLSEALFHAKPTDATIGHELARILGNIGVTVRDKGQPSEALVAFDRARAVLNEIGTANPTLIMIPAASAWIDGAEAEALVAVGRDGEALEALGRARAAREVLIKANPAVTRNYEQLIRAHRQIADIHRRAGRMPEVLSALQSARQVASSLASTHPEDRHRPVDFAWACTDIGDLLGLMGKPAEAMASFDEALLIHRKLVAANPSTPSYRSDLARTLRLCGIAMQKCHRLAEAESVFRESITILRQQTKLSSGDYYDIACFHSLLSGIAALAGSGLTAAAREAEADNAMESLRRAIAAGWRNPAHMRTDPDLDPIRSRPDFQMLALDLAMPDNPFAQRD